MVQELEVCSAGWLMIGHDGVCCDLHCGIAGIALSQPIFLSVHAIIMPDLMGIRYKFIPQHSSPTEDVLLKEQV